MSWHHEDRCHRCKKVGADTPVATFRQPNPGYTLMNYAVYHHRCLPPALFHELAGSRPASHKSPFSVSLGKPAPAGGGVAISFIQA